MEILLARKWIHLRLGIFQENLRNFIGTYKYSINIKKKRQIVCFASEIWDIFRRSPAGSSSSLSRNTVTPASEGDSTTSSWSSEKDTSLFDAP